MKTSEYRKFEILANKFLKEGKNIHQVTTEDLQKVLGKEGKIHPYTIRGYRKKFIEELANGKIKEYSALLSPPTNNQLDPWGVAERNRKVAAYIRKHPNSSASVVSKALGVNIPTSSYYDIRKKLEREEPSPSLASPATEAELAKMKKEHLHTSPSNGLVAKKGYAPRKAYTPQNKLLLFQSLYRKEGNMGQSELVLLSEVADAINSSLGTNLSVAYLTHPSPTLEIRNVSKG